MTTTDPETAEPENLPAEAVADPAVARVIETTMTELALSPSQTTFTPDQLSLLAARGMKVSEIPPAHLSGFMALCLYRGVNPFIGEATIMKTEDGWAAIMQIDGFRAKAEETGEYQGTTHPEWCGDDGVWHEAWPDAWGEPVAGRVGVRRRGWPEPVYAVAHVEEYKVYEWVQDPSKPRGTRTRMPTKSWRDGGLLRLMIVKCAKAAAFRDAFPRILAGFYAPEEMERVKRERLEAERVRAVAEGEARRAAAYAAAQPARETREEGVQEGEVVKHQGETMDAVDRLRKRAQESLAEEAAEAVEIAEEAVAAQAEALDLIEETLSAEERAEALRAELDMQADVLGVPVAKLVSRWETTYETPLGTWDDVMLLRVVSKHRRQVVARLWRDPHRQAQAAAYGAVGEDEVRPVEDLLGL